MKIILAALMMIAALLPAYAQETNSANKNPMVLKYEREMQEQKENERLYNEQMKRLKAQGATPTNNDPWKTVRPSEAAAPKR